MTYTTERSKIFQPIGEKHEAGTGDSRMFLDSGRQDVSGFWTAGCFWILDGRMFLDSRRQDVSGFTVVVWKGKHHEWREGL
jgi:hypothetical protein